MEREFIEELDKRVTVKKIGEVFREANGRKKGETVEREALEREYKKMRQVREVGTKATKEEGKKRQRRSLRSR